MSEAGIYVDYVPAEAHNKIGLIERRNAVFRSLMERRIDQRAIRGREQCSWQRQQQHSQRTFAHGQQEGLHTWQPLAGSLVWAWNCSATHTA